MRRNLVNRRLLRDHGYGARVRRSPEKAVFALRVGDRAVGPAPGRHGNLGVCENVAGRVLEDAGQTHRRRHEAEHERVVDRVPIHFDVSGSGVTERRPSDRGRRGLRGLIRSAGRRAVRPLKVERCLQSRLQCIAESLGDRPNERRRILRLAGRPAAVRDRRTQNVLLDRNGISGVQRRIVGEREVDRLEAGWIDGRRPGGKGIDGQNGRVVRRSDASRRKLLREAGGHCRRILEPPHMHILDDHLRPIHAQLPVQIVSGIDRDSELRIQP